MNWKHHIEKLASGEETNFKAHGNSMTPRIHSGDVVFISPWQSAVEKGDIVFCKVKGHYYVHLVHAVKGNRYLIGNNHGRVNGWIGANKIFGKFIGLVRPK